MAEAWYVQDEGGAVSGPFLEKQIAEALFSGQIRDTMRLRQSDSDWCEASRARQIFRQLAEHGWYVRQRNQTHGPFTDVKLRELYQTGKVELAAELRRGTVGPWRSASAIAALSRHERPEATELTSAENDIDDSFPAKWATEPVRHVLLRLSRTSATNRDGSLRSDIVGRCQPHERLLLHPPISWLDEQRLLRVTRTNGEQLGCLSAADTRQILDNADRGIRHVVLLDSVLLDSVLLDSVLLDSVLLDSVLLDSVQSHGVARESHSVQLAVVLCPPGTPGKDTASYIEQRLMGQRPGVA